MINDDNYQLFILFMELLSLIRKNVVKDMEIPGQEIYLAIGCFLKLHQELPKLRNMNNEESYSYLIDAYSRESDLKNFFDSSHYYTIPNYFYLINHLHALGLLHDFISVISRYIEEHYNFEKCISLKTEIYLSEYDDFLPDGIVIERNCDGTFFTRGEYNNISDFFYEELTPYLHLKVSHNDAICIWPFSEGYARVLGKDGRWGYLSQENNKITWINNNVSYFYNLEGNKTNRINLEGSVLYAEDFKCERARLQLDDDNKSYMYLGLCLDDCFGKTFKKASDFKGGYAVVSDEYCENYTIDVFGEIIDADKKRYEECKLEKEELEEEIEKRSFRHYDPETEVMRSLMGYGADPELFGF